MSPRTMTQLLWATLASLAILMTGVSAPAVAQDKAPAKKVAAKKARKKPRGRLPNYYKGVVSEEQRDKIYAIQAEYREKMDSLRKQLAAMKKEQDEKVQAVLTPEQRKKVEQIAEEAKAKRAKPKPKKEAESKPASK